MTDTRDTAQITVAADEPTDAILDAVGAALDMNRGVWFTPSRIAGKVGITTIQAHRALVWLEDHVMAVADGNGAWRKWRAREWGEGVPR